MLTSRHSEVKKPAPQDCPKCGKPLRVYQVHKLGNDQREPFDFYLCREHGFFLHDQRRTEAGL